MFKLRTSRTRLAGVAATAVLAALSLTACGDGTGAKNEGAGTSAATNSSSDVVPAGSVASPHPTASASATTSTVAKNVSRSTGSTSSAAGSKRTGRTPAPKAPATSSKPVTCEGSNTRTVAAPLTRPVNHMLLTVTNTGSRTCYLYGYPAVQFTDAQAVPPVIEASKPQAVVTLQPGESGYASVSLSATDGSGADGRTVKSLAVHFFGRSLSGSVGAAAHPALPAKGVYIDDSLQVSYWQQSMDDALGW
ncbi:DUF4232 domain-containing protein [Streptomyces gilvus]|uniref:DUF4232 domain-containing protein n=1 Tax=Streptomyces gilvus TaxID=2920937 RepID=UPI001F0DDB30|nr:DUF4232 domain-containing protein [Streptomyces sp. CME 23]MCH5672460.1 DUF4232 domain-containing protein [Streptomyces sp. CME 23]